MNGYSKFLFSLFLSGLTVLSAQATDVTININGRVIASPCTVDGAQSVNVDLGQNIEAASLSTAGSSSEWSSFNLNLKNCPASTSNVTATFSGTADSTSPNYYRNTGTATGVAVQLFKANSSTSLGNGSTFVSAVNATAHTATFPLAARAYTATGNVMPGTIASVVQVTFTYQ
ncbi:TPA: fimbrial protein [Serratia fonticola]